MGQVALIQHFALLALVLASAAHAETDNDTIFRPTAKPRFQIVDGNTVKFGPQLVRLFGIDAAEKGQTCDDGRWQPGPLAKKALEDFIAGRPVTCKQVGYDARNSRPVAQCFAGDDDLQAMLVSAGWALVLRAVQRTLCARGKGSSDAQRRCAWLIGASHLGSGARSSVLRPRSRLTSQSALRRGHRRGEPQEPGARGGVAQDVEQRGTMGPARAIVSAHLGCFCYLSEHVSGSS